MAVLYREFGDWRGTFLVRRFRRASGPRGIALFGWHGCGGWLIVAQRPQGKEFVTAGFATQRGDSKQTSRDGSQTRNVFGRDTLQFKVAAISAMGIEKGAKGQ
jgi:hypothetical protein